jgi:phage-related protein
MVSNLANCSAGIAIAIGSNLIAFSKVLKIRAAIRGLGGVAKVMEQIIDRTRRGEQLMAAVTEVFNDAGAGLGAIAAEFLSLERLSSTASEMATVYFACMESPERENNEAYSRERQLLLRRGT